MPTKKVKTPLDALNANLGVSTRQRTKPGHGVLKNPPLTPAPAGAKPKAGSYVKPGGKATGKMKDYALNTQARRDEYTARGWKQDKTTEIKSAAPTASKPAAVKPSTLGKGSANPYGSDHMRPKSKKEIEAYANDKTNFKGKTQAEAMQNNRGSNSKIDSNIKGKTSDVSKISMQDVNAAENKVANKSNNGSSSSLPSKFPTGVNSGQSAPAPGTNITSSIAKRSAAADKTQITNNTNVNKITASTAKGNPSTSEGSNSISSRSTRVNSLTPGQGSGMTLGSGVEGVENEIASLARKLGPASSSASSSIEKTATKAKDPSSKLIPEKRYSSDIEKDLMASLDKKTFGM